MRLSSRRSTKGWLTIGAVSAFIVALTLCVRPAALSGERRVQEFQEQQQSLVNPDKRPFYTDAQLQRVFCECHSDDRRTIEYAYGELAAVGGWFSIRLYREAMEEGAWLHHREMRYAKGTVPDIDVGSIPPVGEAIMHLPALIGLPEDWEKQVPGQLGSSELERWNNKARFVRAWVDIHAADLRKLEPTGDGIEWSLTSCPQGKGKKKPKET